MSWFSSIVGQVSILAENGVTGSGAGVMYCPYVEKSFDCFAADIPPIIR